MSRFHQSAFSILVVVFTIKTTETYAECRYDRGYEFPQNYECRLWVGRLNFQSDGNLVIYDIRNEPKWSTSTEGYGDRAVFQDDGNLVVYDGAGTAKWSSNTVGTGRRLTFQDDRNLVIYNNQDRPVWSSNTDVG